MDLGGSELFPTTRVSLFHPSFFSSSLLVVDKWNPLHFSLPPGHAAAVALPKHRRLKSRFLLFKCYSRSLFFFFLPPRSPSPSSLPRTFGKVTSGKSAQFVLFLLLTAVPPCVHICDQMRLLFPPFFLSFYVAPFFFPVFFLVSAKWHVHSAAHASSFFFAERGAFLLCELISFLLSKVSFSFSKKNLGPRDLFRSPFLNWSSIPLKGNMFPPDSGCAYGKAVILLFLPAPREVRYHTPPPSATVFFLSFKMEEKRTTLYLLKGNPLL